jgi:hypothetical protein
MGRPRAVPLPGMEDRGIPEIHAAAINYDEVKKERMELTEKEVSLKSNLLVLMKQHKLENYNYAGIEVSIESKPAEETIKVRVKLGEPEKKEGD